MDPLIPACFSWTSAYGKQEESTTVAGSITARGAEVQHSPPPYALQTFTMARRKRDPSAKCAPILSCSTSCFTFSRAEVEVKSV
eukprot:scaffold31223_cov27-Tisochrysis_lutea.AAC.1